ncbi:MAG: SPASM domain-containing protein [Bacteroidia bacterium]|nr:SPASM domain-containing protein [Bacteroidia bacterium]
MVYLYSSLFYYYLGIFKKLSLAKCLNYLKLLFGFYYSRVIGKPKQFGMPVYISIEPTTSCNLRCPQCPSGLREFSRPTGMLQTEMFHNTINQLSKHLHSLTFYFQGEPYLNPSFLNMVEQANAKGIYTITSTNAHYMSAENARKTVESGLDKLIISVDGTTQEVYEQYRKGGQLEKVIEGTKEILKQKRLLKSRSPYVIWQFVVFKPNQHQVNEVKRMGKDLGVDEVKIKTAQIYDFENGNELIPDINRYSRYQKNEEGNYRIKNKLLNQCWRMWQGCVVTWDGKIVPCCFDKDAKHTLGNLEKESFKTIWHSESYNHFRRSILKSRDQVDICTNCTEGTQVWS